MVKLNEVIIDGVYRHFKGELYKVITVAHDTEMPTRKLVIYQALYAEKLIWARDYEMFTSKVDNIKYPNADQEYRFELIKQDGNLFD